MYSMRPEFSTSGRWLSRVSWIMDEGLQQHYRRKTPRVYAAPAGIEPDLSLSRDRLAGLDHADLWSLRRACDWPTNCKTGDYQG